MKTTQLQTDVQKFIETLKAETVTNERVKICTQLRVALEKEYTPATVKTYLSSYRKALIDAFGENKHLLKFLRLPKAKRDKLERDYKTAVELRYENNSELHTIPAPSELIEFCKELLTSDSYTKVSLGLMLLTGRRTAEILKTATFHKIQNKAFEVVFEGQTKLKDRELNPFKIPILAPANEIIKALEWLRKTKDFSQLTNEQVNKRCANGLNQLTKQLFKNWLGNDCTPHDLRKAYATISHNQSNKKDSFRGFAAKVLGHSENSELATETYRKYTI